MGSAQNKKAGNYFKGLMRKAQDAINLVIGNSEVYSEEDTGGDLRFDPAIMLKINVTFDKDFLPKEKVVKLNVRGNRFFYDIKRNLREINGLYIVYPQEYEIQFDVRREEWEKRLIKELNDEYQLALRKIRFVNEEEICRKYQREGIKNIRNPYNLKKGELLVLAGGFANFNKEGIPIAAVKVNLAKESGEKNGKGVKMSQQGNYYGRYSQKAGAYFYVGGEWYHNLFIPELFHPEDPCFFSFRIADDGKKLKFFSDLKKRGIDIRANVKFVTHPEFEKIIYTINPAYLGETQISDFKLSIIYDVKEEEEESPAVTVVTADPSDTTPEELPIQIDTLPDLGIPEMEKGEEEKAGKEEILRADRDDEETKEIGRVEENLPCLENEMILLPCPKDDDISSYMMTIGDEKKNVQFYTSSFDKEISILAPEKEEKIYKRKFSETVDYSIKLDSINYSISNTFLSRVEDKILKLYFAWELKTNAVERIYLESDFYIFGREPLDNLAKHTTSIYEQLVLLSTGDNDFWRIGASRDHAVLLKEKNTHILYNISLSYPIYLLKPADLAKPVIPLSRLEPVSGEKNEEKLVRFLAEIKEEIIGNGKGSPGNRQEVSYLSQSLADFAPAITLKNNDLLIIGSKVYKYNVPVVMESPLSERVQKSVLRKMQVSQSVLR